MIIAAMTPHNQPPKTALESGDLCLAGRACWARISASWSQWAPEHVLPTEKQRPRASPSQDSAGFSLADIPMSKGNTFHPHREETVSKPPFISSRLCELLKLSRAHLDGSSDPGGLPLVSALAAG